MRIRKLAALLCACLMLCAPALGEEAAPQAQATEAPASETLSGKSKGEAVVRLQKRLAELGYHPGNPDGLYGAGTKSAVRVFQQQNGLEADGLAGAKTLAVLYSENAVRAPEPVDVLAGELPMLTNKEKPVSEGFEPANLVVLSEYCDKNLVRIKYKNIRAVQEAADALIAMLEAARAENVTKWQISAGYRSYESQLSTLTTKINSYMKKNPKWSRAKAKKAALRTVAEPGTSEHQLGLALDINVPGADTFLGTKQCTWLHAHCWDYGFIVRYQKGKEKITGYDAEAWHIRYVGVAHAKYMRDHDLCLEEYLAGLEAGDFEVPVEEIEEDIMLDD